MGMRGEAVCHMRSSPANRSAFAFCILHSSFFLPPAFHPQPIERLALRLLLAGCDLVPALKDLG
jgi:hypothetical protein